MAAVLKRRPGAVITITKALDARTAPQQLTPRATNSSNPRPKLVSTQRISFVPALFALTLKHPCPITIFTHPATVRPTLPLGDSK